jgi:glyoxylase-like metal-dependent hydrolase (beta-lactamase superfamily II)
MQIQTFIFNRIRTCTYVAWDDSGSCIFVDAGCETAVEQQRIVDFITERRLVPTAVCNTHAHPDHVAGNAFLCRHYGIAAMLHPADNEWYARSAQHGLTLGMQFDAPPAPLPLGEEVRFGRSKLQVLHTPGHSKGCVCLYSKEDSVVFTGDTLFAGCIGRTDLRDGNYDQIMTSIHTKLLSLPDNTRILAGHGYPSDIGSERLRNPFLMAA